MTLLTTARTRGSVDTTEWASLDDAASVRFHQDLAGRALQPLAVVIAAFDEQDAIGAVLLDIPQIVCGLGVDVIVVVDGARDATAQVSRDSKRAGGVLVADVPDNRGQGAALRLGYRLAREGGARYIATLDADGQWDPGELALVVQPLLDDTADFVSGSRRLGVAQTSDTVRGAGVVVFGRILSWLSGREVTDPANGLRAMRAELTAEVPLHQQQYQASELLLGAALLGWRTSEAATTMRVRAAGSTKKGRNLLYGLRFARAIAATWWRLRGSRQRRNARLAAHGG